MRLLALLLAFSPIQRSLAADWATYGGSAERLNYNSGEVILSASTVPGLKLHWKTQISATAKTQPLFVEQVATANGTHDEVFVSLQDGHIQALNAATGQVDWSFQAPAGSAACPGTATLGINGTPTIDTAAGLLYVVDGTGNIHALGIGTGQEAPGYPVQVIDTANQGVTYNHSSPTLVGGLLYITTSNPCEEQPGAYHGQVLMFDPVALAVVSRFFPVGNGAVNGGGIWGPGGVSAEADGSFLYGATANALPHPDTAPHAEQVLQLDPSLNLLAFNGPALSKGGDFDFGTTPLLIDAPGCPPMLAAMNKTGILLVYQRMAIGAGAVQTLTISSGGGNSAFIGMPSYDPALQNVYVNNPLSSKDGSFVSGAIALHVAADCTLATLWQQPMGTGMPSSATRSTAPVLANGVVWMSLGAAKQMMALDESTGAVLWSSGALITGSTTASPTVADGQVFVQGGKALYAFGL